MHVVVALVSIALMGVLLAEFLSSSCSRDGSSATPASLAACCAAYGPRGGDSRLWRLAVGGLLPHRRPASGRLRAGPVFQRGGLLQRLVALGARRYARQDPRLTREDLDELRRRLEGSALHVDDSEEARDRLEELRRGYEPYAVALSRQLALELPDWLPGEHVRDNWRQATGAKRQRSVS